MKKLILLVFMLLALSIAVQGQQTPVRTDYHTQTGMLRFIGGSASQPVMSADARGVASVLDVYAPQFGVAANDLTKLTEKTVDQRVVRRYQQNYQGVPVFGGQLIVQTTARGDLIAMIGEASPNLAISTVPSVVTASAQQTAIRKVVRDYGYDASTLSTSQPELWIYDARLLEDRVKPVALVWKLEVTSSAHPTLRELVLVNAHFGGIELNFNQIDDHWNVVNAHNHVAAASLALPAAMGPRVPGTADLATYNANNDPDILPGTFLCDETNMACTGGVDTDADAAHIFAKAVYDFYWTNHNRDSLDAAGMQIISSVNVDTNYCNAFWSGEQMGYGDGCLDHLNNFTSIVVDDVVGHELTHGVTDFESDLIYYSQSGAINESLSDVWGELFDLSNGTPEDLDPENRWRIGEEMEFTEGLPGIRDMQDPTIFLDPDQINGPEYYHGFGDSAGVHYNSGVNNKATYLMVDGDTFNGYEISSIGSTKVLALYYEVQTNLLTAASNYLDLHLALLQACQTLIGGASGMTAADCVEVEEATLAVEMDEIPVVAAGPTATVCPTGQEQDTVLFADHFENGGTNWTVTGTPGIWNTQHNVANPYAPINGNVSLFGRGGDGINDADSEIDAAAQMVNAVTLPAGASYLHFNHQFRMEQGWDGSVVEYSTNGTNWNILTSAFFDEGLDHTGTIFNVSDTPLANQMAFTGLRGLSSTRYDLSTLAGQSVRFRFRNVSDIYYGDTGWIVDDVQVYTCAVPAPGVTVSKATATVTEGGATDSYTVVLEMEPTQNVMVNITNNSTEVTADKTQLTFTNADWDTPQVVTLTAVDDTEDEAVENAGITHTVVSDDLGYNGLTVASVNVTINDNDEPAVTAGVTVSKATAAVAEGGATDSYTVVLNTQPTADVTVALTVPADLTASAASVIFTSANWNVAQTVTVTASDDTEAEGTETANISHAATSGDLGYNGIAVASVAVTITDNDLQVTELLVNPGFELHTVSNKLPDTWVTKGLAKDRLKCDTETLTFARTGECAFRFVGSLGENARLSQVTENVSALTAGMTLKSGVYYKTNNAKPRLKVKLVVFAGTTVLGRVKTTINTVATAYTEFPLDDYTIPTGSTVTKVKFQLQNRALAGKIYVDDATVNYGVMLTR